MRYILQIIKSYEVEAFDDIELRQKVTSLGCAIVGTHATTIKAINIETKHTLRISVNSQGMTDETKMILESDFESQNGLFVPVKSESLRSS